MSFAWSGIFVISCFVAFLLFGCYFRGKCHSLHFFSLREVMRVSESFTITILFFRRDHLFFLSFSSDSCLQPFILFSLIIPPSLKHTNPWCIWRGKSSTTLDFLFPCLRFVWVLLGFSSSLLWSYFQALGKFYAIFSSCLSNSCVEWELCSFDL